MQWKRLKHYGTHVIGDRGIVVQQDADSVEIAAENCQS
jgi:hypothetical protein